MSRESGHMRAGSRRRVRADASRRSTRRRLFLAAAAVLVAPFARAQKPAATTRTLGLLSPQHAPAPQQAEAPLPRLRELGWIEGKNLRIERAYGQGNEDRLPQLAAELVRKRVDVIWAFGPDAAIAAAKATKTVPIVFWGVNNPVEWGLVDSLARPGGNVTGVAFSEGVEIVQKALELVREILPGARRVAWMRFPIETRGPSGESIVLGPIVSAAKTLGLELQPYPVERAEDFDAVFKKITASRAQALWVPATPLTFRERKRILDFATRNRVPAVGGARWFVEGGGLVSYGADSPLMIRQSADYVDRILRGARPADLPVELPTRYELAVNLKTAKALGIIIPQSVLVRAEKVIE